MKQFDLVTIRINASEMKDKISWNRQPLILFTGLRYVNINISDKLIAGQTSLQFL